MSPNVFKIPVAAIEGGHTQYWMVVRWSYNQTPAVLHDRGWSRHYPVVRPVMQPVVRTHDCCITLGSTNRAPPSKRASVPITGTESHHLPIDLSAWHSTHRGMHYTGRWRWQYEPSAPAGEIHPRAQLNTDRPINQSINQAEFFRVA